MKKNNILFKIIAFAVIFCCVVFICIFVRPRPLVKGEGVGVAHSMDYYREPVELTEEDSQKLLGILGNYYYRKTFYKNLRIYSDDLVFAIGYQDGDDHCWIFVGDGFAIKKDGTSNIACEILEGEQLLEELQKWYEENKQ